ncbi:MAG: TRAP transporter substrate-binding protein [Rhizobiales bacterium]|nr:TRAP transporter substrate-binding protein [Hyphomicrobiales bacterium]
MNFQLIYKAMRVGLAAICASAMMMVLAQAETLKLAHFVPPAHTFTGAIVDPLVNGVNTATGGSLEIQVYPGGELGKGPVEQYVRAVNGVADITWGLAGYTSAQFPLSMIVELPGVVGTSGMGYEAIWNAYEDHLTGEFPGTRPLALWTSEPMLFIMKDKEIRTVADLAGLKIRVSGAVPARVIEALGATPVHMPAPQMYNALQTGLVDGIMTGASAIHDFRLSEVANIYTEGPSLGNILFFVVMNEATYSALPANEQAAIDANSGLELSKSGEDNWNRVATETMAALRADPNKMVISLTGDDAAAFDVITLAVRDAVVSELDANGLAASAVLSAMTGQ